MEAVRCPLRAVGGHPAGGKALKVAAAVGMRSLYRRTGGRRRTATKKGHRHAAGGAYSGARPPESQGSPWKRSTTHGPRKKSTAVCCEKGFEKRGMIGATACCEKNLHRQEMECRPSHWIPQKSAPQKNVWQQEIGFGNSGAGAGCLPGRGGGARRRGIILQWILINTRPATKPLNTRRKWGNTKMVGALLVEFGRSLFLEPLIHNRGPKIVTYTDEK